MTPCSGISLLRQKPPPSDDSDGGGLFCAANTRMNHLYGIIVISDKMSHPVETSRWGVSYNRRAPDCRLSQHETPQHETPQRGVSTDAGRLVSGSLGAIIGQFKAACTKRIWSSGHDFAWQPRFHEHIIRDEKILHNIREYIATNPLKWESDRNHPANITP